MIIYFTNYVFGSLCSFSFFFGSFGIYFFGDQPCCFCNSQGAAETPRGSELPGPNSHPQLESIESIGLCLRGIPGDVLWILWTMLNVWVSGWRIATGVYDDAGAALSSSFKTEADIYIIIITYYNCIYLIFILIG